MLGKKNPATVKACKISVTTQLKEKNLVLIGSPKVMETEEA